ncbi:nucleoside kinase [Ruminococcus sp. FC2018]|uniref:uridine kinase family protein n=1 Tax=Ruminococcus sp. FC2018 TaxID=1410617 RepID=UPI00048D3519|nr:nucleoside kinase [Ruminococcus sp. FC2018]
MKVIHVNALNHRILQDEKKFIAESDNNYTQRLTAIADNIENSKDSRPILLLAGPSGSGKTTTALKIREILLERGIITYNISLDNYFVPKERFPVDENGKVDLESPAHVDKELFVSQLTDLFNGKEITLPIFNFPDQSRHWGPKLKREKDEIFIFEGTHALNPSIVGEITGYSHKMYVSVRTRLQYDVKGEDDRLLDPAYIRLMRRIIRDILFRGREITATLDMFDSVEAGEVKYIMPFKNLAEYSVDSFIPYEVPAYKSFILGKLKNAIAQDSKYERFSPITQALTQIGAITLDNIPPRSLIREFIGDSEYKY